MKVFFHTLERLEELREKQHFYKVFNYSHDIPPGYYKDIGGLRDQLEQVLLRRYGPRLANVSHEYAWANESLKLRVNSQLISTGLLKTLLAFLKRTAAPDYWKNPPRYCLIVNAYGTIAEPSSLEGVIYLSLKKVAVQDSLKPLFVKNVSFGELEQFEHDGFPTDKQTPLIEKRAPLRILKASGEIGRSYCSARWSPDGESIAWRQGDSIHIRQVKPRGKKFAIEAGPGGWKLDWSPDGRFISCSVIGSVTIWDVENRRKLSSLNDSGRLSISWNRDSSLIAIGSEKGLLLWDFQSGAERKLMVPFWEKCDAVAWSFDGNWLASAHSRETHSHNVIWDVRENYDFRKLDGFHKKIYDLKWNAKGTQLACLNFGRTIQVIDVLNGAVYREFDAEIGLITSLSWSYCGTMIVVSGKNKVKVWEVESGDCIEVLPGLHGEFNPTCNFLSVLGMKNDRIEIYTF